MTTPHDKIKCLLRVSNEAADQVTSEALIERAKAMAISCAQADIDNRLLVEPAQLLQLSDHFECFSPALDIAVIQRNYEELKADCDDRRTSDQNKPTVLYESSSSPFDALGSDDLAILKRYADSMWEIVETPGYLNLAEVLSYQEPYYDITDRETREGAYPRRQYIEGFDFFPVGETGLFISQGPYESEEQAKNFANALSQLKVDYCIALGDCDRKDFYPYWKKPEPPLESLGATIWGDGVATHDLDGLPDTKAYQFDIVDMTAEPLTHHQIATLYEVAQALKRPETKVLVHCRSGYGRSAMIIGAIDWYLNAGKYLPQNINEITPDCLGHYINQFRESRAGAFLTPMQAVNSLKIASALFNHEYDLRLSTSVDAMVNRRGLSPLRAGFSGEQPPDAADALARKSAM